MDRQDGPPTRVAPKTGVLRTQSVPPNPPNAPGERAATTSPVVQRHNAETSGETVDATDVVTPRSASFDDAVQREVSHGHRKPVPPLPFPSRTPSPEEETISFPEPPESPRSPVDRGPVLDSSDIVSPSPHRDTIHNIVDGYNRDSILSTSTVDLPESEAEDVDTLAPPAPIFDLTPGRESSPARYKHGEPLNLGEL